MAESACVLRFAAYAGAIISFQEGSKLERKLQARLAATGAACEVTIRDGHIVQTAPIPDAPELPWLAPGFIDHQVNGFAGHDVNDEATSADSLRGLTEALWATGVTRYCPTIITNSEERIIQSLRAIAQACRESVEVDAAIVAVHVEGPFISPEDGPRGAHHPAYVRPPDWDEFLRWQDAAEGRIGIVTLSPEWPEATDFIERLAAQGVIASIGHTAATPEQIRDAVKAGARMSTHLGNGSHLMLPRHPNYIWEQLAIDELWAGLVLDGFHLPPSVAKAMLRAKGLERVALTTDAVAMAGLPPGYYQLNGVDVELTPQGKIEVVGGRGILAGSALTMPVGIANAMRFADLSLSEAVSLATTRPAALLGLPDVSVATGNRADLTLFYLDPASGDLQIVATFLRGELVYGKVSPDKKAGS